MICLVRAVERDTDSLLSYSLNVTYFILKQDLGMGHVRVKGQPEV